MLQGIAATFMYLASDRDQSGPYPNNPVRQVLQGQQDVSRPPVTAHGYTSALGLTVSYYQSGSTAIRVHRCTSVTAGVEAEGVGTLT